MIKHRCPHCRKSVKIPDQYAGMEVKCPKCSGSIDLAADDPSEKDQPKADQPASVEAIEPSPPKPADNSDLDLDMDDDDLSIDSVGDAEDGHCPNCDGELADDAVLCMACGYNNKTGQVMGTNIDTGDADAAGPKWKFWKK